MHGRVASFDAAYGYGFIAVDGLQEIVFVHSSAIAAPSVTILQVGQLVAFDLVTDLDAPRAVNVTPVQHAGCSPPRHRIVSRAAGRGPTCSGPKEGSARAHRLSALAPRGAGRNTAGQGQRDTRETGDAYTLSRVLDAPVTKVWQVLTRPEHFVRWLHVPLESISVDLRPGGSWQAIAVAPDGTQHPMTGCYPEVVPHQRLIHTLDAAGFAPPAAIDITLTVLGNQTRIVYTRTTAASEEHERASAGGERALDGLATYLATYLATG